MAWRDQMKDPVPKVEYTKDPVTLVVVASDMSPFGVGFPDKVNPGTLATIVANERSECGLPPVRGLLVWRRRLRARPCQK